MNDLKKEISDFLVQKGVIKINTEQVVFNCNSGAVSDWKEVTRYK